MELPKYIFINLKFFMNSETQLLEKFGSEFVSQGHAELVNLLNPVRNLKRATIPATEIKPSKVKWIVPNILKESSLHLLGGDPNAGKSFLSIELASQISRGGELFGHRVQPGKVIMFGSEDNASDTVIPRLLTQGANLENIFTTNQNLLAFKKLCSKKCSNF